MLESYVTPLLMSYVNRYIKNLKPSDLQLSLWGGDVVLSKLELKLDVLEQELKLPFAFLSGHIHELRIHVPWTKLGSEPVVITINTMECILKLRDGAQDDHESCGSSSTSRSASESAKSLAKPRRVQQAAPSDPDLPPGYVQSLIRRVVNNVNIVVNNLILKYVEDDIVLSVNITSAECYTVDEFWDRAFMDIAAPDLVLRKVINFSDCTVCLDKRNASGKIEFYQDPLLYKCSFRTRLHFTYDNINSKIPAVIKIQTMVESLKLSLTDQQLPMFIRIMELGVALYYGEIGGHKEGEGEDPGGHARETAANITSMEGEGEAKALAGQYPNPELYLQSGEGDEQGWVSWAWSFVPAIVSTGEEEEAEEGYYQEAEEGGRPRSPQQHTPKDPVVSIGFYCTKASVTFKLTETQAESSYYSPQKVKSREVLCLVQEGITIEVLMMGEPFFNCQIGFVGCRALCLKGIMGVKDFEENMNRCEEDAVFFSCGETLSSKGMTYLTNSLFDYRSPENNGVRAEFILDANHHKETYTEIAGMQRFGAFYMDYLYTMENNSGKDCVGQQDFSAVSKEEVAVPVQETSVKRLVVGPLDIRLHSGAVHRILKMVACALDHEYEPYCRPQPDVVEDGRAPPGPEEVAALEEFIPTRLTCVTLLKVSVTVSMAEFNLLDCLLPVILGQKGSAAAVSAPVFQPVRPLPAVRVQVDKVNLEHSVPMYAPELVSTVSSLSQPSDNLLHHCYAHCYLKVFGFQAGLTCMESDGSFLPLIPIIPSFSTALYGKLLRLPAYWTKRSFVPITECIFELPHFTIQATRAQTLLLQAICQSWTHNLGNGASPGVNEALLNEVYKASGAKPPSPAPTLEGSVQNVELKYCSRASVRCASGTVGAVKVCARTPGAAEGEKEKLVPLIQGPSDTKELHMRRWLNEIRKPESLLAPDLLAFSVQVPQQGEDCRNSGAVLLVSVQGVAVNVDPVFCTWLLHQPQKGSSRLQQQTPGAAPVGVPAAKRREDEASVGSTPLVKPPSNQASDYASSPVKTKTVTESRPLSLPMKVMQAAPEPWVSSEERMKELIARVWDAVKRLTLQLELQSCCVFLPNDSLPSPSTIVCGDIPGTVRSWYHNQASMPGTLVVCLPQVSVLSAGHKYMEPLQEIPFVVSRPILEEGDAFPWTVNLSQFSVYTLLGQQRSLSLLEPMGCTSTLAVTTHKLQGAGPEGRHAFIVCLHVDLEPLHLKCSNPQVQLLYELFHSWSSTWSRLQRRGFLRQTSSYPEPPAGAAPPSPVRSSAGTAPPDTSTCSPSADFGSPTEGDSVPAGDDSPFSDTVTLEQKTSSIGGASGKVSLWMQWMLPKVTVKLFAPDPAAKRTEICVIGELEDLSASVDVQDVYTKIKCKVGSFNIDHYKSSPEEGPRCLGRCGGAVLSCTDKLNRRTVLVRPVSKQDPLSHFSGFFPPTAAKVLEVSHQQHGFLSITYTQAVTKNVRHKLTTRQERGSRGVQRLTEGPADGSPQYLREILLTAQPFDVVLSCPLLATVAGVFQATLPRRYRDKGRSAGQPMRSHALTSRSLPLIYINTSVIRIFCPGMQDKQPITESHLKKEDTLVLKIGSVSMAPQADNPLSRTVLRKDIYQRALNLGILRDPGSEVEDRQYQVDLQSINIGTAQWEQLKPEKEGAKGGALAESERNSQNPALEWNMASSIRRHQERRAILTPILTDFSVRVTAAPAIIFSKPVSPDNAQVEEIVVCGHSLEVNMTTSLDFFLSVAQVQLLQQLLRANVVGNEGPEKTAEVWRHEQQLSCASRPSAVDTSSRHSGAQDSGFGSDSARIRIVQIEQQSGASHHRIARPSRKSTITKNLSFIPFDIFLTASRVSLMTYACVDAPKARPDPAPSPGPTSPEKKEGEKVGKSALNMPDGERADAPADPALAGISALTAEDLLNGNAPAPLGARVGGGLLSLESLHAPSRSSARQALGVTIVRQPGRRGAGDVLLEPLLYLQVFQPSALLSCHHRKQRMELSVFDVALKGVASDYKCLDPGKTLPEALDYSVFWLQTVAGEADGKTGIPPPLLALQIKDFLNGPAELNVELSRPLKANPTLAKLEQAKAFLARVFPEAEGEAARAPATPQCSPGKAAASRTPPRPESAPQTPAYQRATGRAGTLAALAPFHRVSLRTAQMVVVLETEAHPARPSLTVSVSGMTGSLSMRTGPKVADPVQAASFLLELQDVLLKTGLRDRSRVLLGPFCCSADLEAKWCRHSGNAGPEQGPPKLLLDLKGGLLQVFWGQEHLNSLELVRDHLQSYLQGDGAPEAGPEDTPQQTQPPPSPGPHTPKTEHSSDDLRTGLFQYIQDSASKKLPGTYEVVFYNETDDNPGVMLWRYPEPRVLTFVRITPVPFNTTEDPDISTADLGDVLQVPCSLEYWDELQRAFVPYREFSLSESSACELQLPSVGLASEQKELVASDLWRIVLNSSADGGDEQSSDSESGSQLPCDQLVSPTALAACTRVDSCFAPWFVPSVGVSLQLAQMELHLCHHLEQLGTAPAERLRPFLPDRKLPQEQEYLVVGAREPRVYLRQWSSGAQQCQEFQFSTELDCRLLEYRNLTLLRLVQPFTLQGQAAASRCPRQQLLDGNVFVDPVFINVSQYTVHTLDTALQAWKQNQVPDAEELVFSHYVICNDTHETLRFGQVDTDENVLLASLHSHQYSWRSHKSPQLLHICIEGWGNWRWSEPFSVDNVGTLLRTIQYKGRTASLIIKIQQLNGVQKQIVICGRQVMCSYLSQDIELRVVQHYVGPDGQTVVKEHADCLAAGRKLPSYVLEDAEMTELCVRARGDEDWSQDVRLERQEKGNSSVVQVPCSNGSLLYVWCTLLTIEPDSHMQQRVVVFSPLFLMRSHLPDPVIIHIEKRSLGLRESQMIPGQGHEEPLLNVESDLTHHLTFQAREEDDPSQCAVPISTGLIKQIVNKTVGGDSQGHILSDFYGEKSSTQPPWPYVSKDSDRPGSETLTQWDSPMQVKLSAWKPGLNTLLIELLPWALLANHSHWDLWLFEGERIVLQVPAGKVIVPPNFKEAFQIGIYWATTNTVHKSTALKLVHDLTSPRWKEGAGGDVLTLDEEGFVEAEITLGAAPSHQKLCQFCVSSSVRHGIQILQIEDRTVLVNNTPHCVYYRPLLCDHALGSADQPYDPPDTTVFALPPGGTQAAPQPVSVPCWDLLREGTPAEAEAPLPLRHMLFSSAPGAESGGGAWSLPAPIRPDFPRQSVAVPTGPCPHTGLLTRPLVLTYQEHMGVTYVTLNEDPCPRMLIHNKCPIPLLLKENHRDTPRTQVYCRPVPATSSLHHELYHHFSSFPDCRQREALPTLLLRATPPVQCSEEWTDPIDINCPGTQVVFLPGFGCLYVDVLHHSGTITLTLAPEGRADSVISQHHRTSSQALAFRVLLSEASVALRDDITSATGSVELLRLTLSKLLLNLAPAEPAASQAGLPEPCGVELQLHCASLQVDNQLYNRASFHFPVLLCQEQRAEPAPWSCEANPTLSLQALEDYKSGCFLSLGLTLSGDGRHRLDELTFQLKPARLYLEDTFVYYIKTLFYTYIPDTALGGAGGGRSGQALPEPVRQSVRALVSPLQLQRLCIQPVSLLVSIHASLKLYIASDHTPLSFSLFERGPLCTTARQLVHALAMHYAAGALFRAGWVVGSLEILGSPASLVRSIGNGIADFFRLPYEGLTRGPGAFVSGVSRGTTSFVKHISKGTLTSITNLATSLARNMDRLSLDEEHYTRQEEWRRQLPESLGDGLRQGLSRLGISLLGAIAGIVDQPMQNFQRTWEMQGSAGSKAKGVISGVGKGIVGVFTKPIGGAAELVSQTGYGILHGAGLWQLPRQLYLPIEEKSAHAPNSHVKYVWKMLQSLGRPEVHMALEVTIVSGSGQEHAGCLLLTGEVLFVVSLSEDTQQQAFPITEVECQQEPGQQGLLTLTLRQQRVTSDTEGDSGRERLSEQQYRRLMDYVTRASQHLSPSGSALQQQAPVTPAEPPPAVTKTYRYLVEPAFARVFVSKFTMVKNKALRIGFH
ncbi:vacuolar protein sorting-associated protein 13B-like isoform X1 [Megalops cyprinoides]|uniref:vacuolar protein sorting-associated protein 13B-like isoform X1 n=1 Tax=Megalops cyprinoides TaxID=118141 RepID=UPI0018649FF7|nr:vacuolar protein sorting-associated protein 13B-like isoform X1 [Megalops cyprinoides]